MMVMVVVVGELVVGGGGDRWQQRRSSGEGRNMIMRNRMVVLSLPVTSLLIAIITLYEES